MEVANLGENSLTYCPCCNELLIVRGRSNAWDEIERLWTAHKESNPECQQYFDTLPTLNQIRERLRPAAEKRERDRRHRITNHPDNGKQGYWNVIGIRNSAVVKASSASEAILKARDADAVGSWESPEAEFIGTELPDVI